MGEPGKVGRSPSEDTKTKEDRRGFLRGAIAGVGALVLGDKYILKPEQEKNNFYKQFKGQEKNYDTAIEAIEFLIAEMKIENIAKVALSGTGHKNYRIEILRDFLTTHLNTKGIGEKYYTRKQVIEQGFYTREDLITLHGQAVGLSTAKQEAPLENESTNKRSKADVINTI